MALVRDSNDGRVRYGVRVNVDLDYIDDVNEEAHVDAELAFHWEDDAAMQWKNETIASMGDKQPLPFMPIPEDVHVLRPTFELMNIRAQEVTSEILLVSSKTGTVYFFRFLRLSIKDIFDLELFPFDRQIVKLQFFSYLSYLEPWFAPIEDAPIRILLHKELKANQFVVNSDEDDWLIAFIDAKLVVDGIKRLFSIRFGVERNSMYYLTNFFVTMFVVVQFGSFVVSIDCTDFSSRSSVTITLLLTLVAFKFVMSSFIPKISYQTFLDKYTVFGTMMLGAIIIENFFVSSLFNIYASPEIEYRDQIFTIVWNLVWWVVHLYLVVGESFNWLRMPWERVKRENERKEQSGSAQQSKGFSIMTDTAAPETAIMTSVGMIKTESINTSNESNKKEEEVDHLTMRFSFRKETDDGTEEFFSGGPPTGAGKKLTAASKKAAAAEQQKNDNERIADSDDD